MREYYTAVDIGAMIGKHRTTVIYKANEGLFIAPDSELPNSRGRKKYRWNKDRANRAIGKLILTLAENLPKGRKYKPRKKAPAQFEANTYLAATNALNLLTKGVKHA